VARLPAPGLLRSACSAQAGTDNAGRALLTLPLPNSPSITGLPFYTQFWIVENTSSFELSWTNAGWMEIGG
jgi:hypothetical protein